VTPVSEDRTQIDWSLEDLQILAGVHHSTLIYRHIAGHALSDCQIGV